VELRDVLQKAVKSKEKYVYLNAMKLFDIPSDLVRIKEHLKGLYLLHNDICEASCVTLSELTQLEELDLSSNNLRRLPSGVFCLAKLQKLFILCNYLTTVPVEICKLRHLKVLGLSGNNFSEIPLPVFDLTQLKTLYLNYNVITTIPPQIKNLVRLSKLSLGYNLIEDIKEVCGLPNLKVLFLRCNRISSLPSDILNLKKLKEISLQGNPLIRSEQLLNGMTQPPTLQQLTATHILRNHIDFYELHMELISFLVNNRTLCSYCKEPFLYPPIQYVILKDFAKGNYIPVQYHLCSESCKRKLLEKK